jgi:purine-cytosine permease-like protein
MIALGALSALATGEWNPVLGVQSLGLGMGSLLLIIFATWTTNDKNLYSGGLALTNLFPGKARWIHTLVLGVIGTTAACLRLTQYFSEWLMLLGVVFAPLLAIVLADHFFVRRRELPAVGVPDAEQPNGATRGVNWSAIVAMVLGVAAGRLVPPEMIQPIVSMVVTAFVYVIGMRYLSGSGS